MRSPLVGPIGRSAMLLVATLCVPAWAGAQEAATRRTGAPLRAAVAREATRLAHTTPRAARSRQAEAPVQPERRWASRHPALTGLLLGTTAGVTYGYVMCRGACEGDPRPYEALFGGIGAGAGAAGGAVVGLLGR